MKQNKFTDSGEQDVGIFGGGGRCSGHHTGLCYLFINEGKSVRLNSLYRFRRQTVQTPAVEGSGGGN